MDDLHSTLERVVRSLDDTLPRPHEYQRIMVSPSEVHFKFNWPILRFVDHGTSLGRTLHRDLPDLGLLPWIDEDTPYEDSLLRLFILNDFIELTRRAFPERLPLEFVVRVIFSLVAASIGVQAVVHDMTEFEPLAVFKIKVTLASAPYEIEIETSIIQRAWRGQTDGLSDRIMEELRVLAAARG
ncbi:MAG TPA: hypothetical protein VGR25_08030 [bacterium]|jgi:hypothetical protein|nr:hypothetical protein [bacterium]